jgi:hypothetical protein
MDRTHRLDLDINMDAEWWLRISEHEQPRQLLNRFIEQRRQSWMRYVEQRRRRQNTEQRPEQARPGSLAANGKVARMMAAMGYVPGVPLGKNRHWITPSPDNQSVFGAGAD